MADYTQQQGQSTAVPEAPPDLDKLKRMFDDYRTLAEVARTQSSIDRDYYDSAFSDASQLTPTQRAILQNRKQPEIVINRVKVAVNGILGVAVQGRTDPRVMMRNPPDEKPQPQQQPVAAPGQPQQAQPDPDLDAADVATMTLRYVADINHFQMIKLDVLENMGVEGSGAVIIEGGPNDDIPISRVAWDEHFYDPRSRRHDFSDARYQGIAKWMYADDVVSLAKAMGKDIAAEIETSFGSGDVSGGADASWLDKPENSSQSPAPAWADSKTRRVMVVEMYYREGGDWYRCMFHAGGIILSEKSQYVDDKNRTLCAIEAQSAYVDRKNRRYGVVRDMRGPQDEINMRRIKAVHEINTRQVQQSDPNAPPVDTDIVRSEAARPDGVIPTGWQVVPRQDVVANNLNLMQEAKTEIERLGPVPAILARGNQDASGRAKQIDQQAGLTELARFFGRYTDWEERVYRQIWARARQFWDAPKWIRVTDDEGAPQYVRINEPGPPQIDPMTGAPVPGPVKNHIAKMDVDIVVDSVPDTAALQQEIFNELMQLAQTYAGGPQAIPFATLIELSPLPKRREIIKKIEADQAKMAQAQAPAAQLDMAHQQTEIGTAQSVARKNMALAGLAEVQTVAAALTAHVDANAAAQLPPGFTLDGNGQHVPLLSPPPGVTGANGPPPGQ